MGWNRARGQLRHVHCVDAGQISKAAPLHHSCACTGTTCTDGVGLQQVYLEEDSRGYMERSSKDMAELGPKKSRSWQRVCQLLSKKQDRIEPVKALTLLPGEVSTDLLLQCAMHLC